MWWSLQKAANISAGRSPRMMRPVKSRDTDGMEYLSWLVLWIVPDALHHEASWYR